MPAVVCLVGPASPQKSRFLEQLAAQFQGRGLSLGLITTPSPGAAGAQISPPAGVLHLRWQSDTVSGPNATLEELLARHFHGVDLVLSELEGPGRVLVEVVPAGQGPTCLGQPGLKALVGAEPPAGSVASFSLDQAVALAEHLAQNVLPPLQPPQAAPPSKLRILVDGRRLPANHFVQDIVNSAIRALIGSLKGGDRAERLEIHLY